MGKVIALPPVLVGPGIVLDQVYQGEHFTMICTTANLAEIGHRAIPSIEFTIDLEDLEKP